jgi:hypothetical protein
MLWRASIEARFHAAESFTSGEATLFGMMRLSDNQAVKEKLGGVFFRYIANDHDETHGICWKIWGLLGVGPESGYGLSQKSGEKVMDVKTKAELKRLFALVFENDRAVREILREALALL